MDLKFVLNLATDEWHCSFDTSLVLQGTACEQNEDTVSASEDEQVDNEFVVPECVESHPALIPEL